MSEVLDQFPKDDPLVRLTASLHAPPAPRQWRTGFLATQRRRGPASGAAGRPPRSGRARLPADAAPAEKQVFIFPADVGTAKVLDFYEPVYQRPFVADLFSEPLVRLNRNFEIIPGVGGIVEGSEDGKTWTFKLEPGA